MGDFTATSRSRGLDMLPGVKISVIGCGYLGAVHAACMADFGHDVVGVDIDEAKVAKLAAGVPSFHEPGLEPLLRAGRRGRLAALHDRQDGPRPVPGSTSSRSAPPSAAAATPPT